MINYYTAVPLDMCDKILSFLDRTGNKACGRRNGDIVHGRILGLFCHIRSDQIILKW